MAIGVLIFIFSVISELSCGQKLKIKTFPLVLGNEAKMKLNSLSDNFTISFLNVTKDEDIIIRFKKGFSYSTSLTININEGNKELYKGNINKKEFVFPVQQDAENLTLNYTFSCGSEFAFDDEISVFSSKYPEILNSESKCFIYNNIYRNKKYYFRIPSSVTYDSLSYQYYSENKAEFTIETKDISNTIKTYGSSSNGNIEIKPNMIITFEYNPKNKTDEFPLENKFEVCFDMSNKHSSEIKIEKIEEPYELNVINRNKISVLVPVLNTNFSEVQSMMIKFPFNDLEIFKNLRITAEPFKNVTFKYERDDYYPYIYHVYYVLNREKADKVDKVDKADNTKRERVIYFTLTIDIPNYSFFPHKKIVITRCMPEILVKYEKEQIMFQSQSVYQYCPRIFRINHTEIISEGLPKLLAYGNEKKSLRIKEKLLNITTDKINEGEKKTFFVIDLKERNSTTLVFFPPLTSWDFKSFELIRTNDEIVYSDKPIQETQRYEIEINDCNRKIFYIGEYKEKKERFANVNFLYGKARVFYRESFSYPRNHSYFNLTVPMKNNSYQVDQIILSNSDVDFLKVECDSPAKGALSIFSKTKEDVSLNLTKDNEVALYLKEDTKKTLYANENVEAEFIFRNATHNASITIGGTQLKPDLPYHRISFEQGKEISIEKVEDGGGELFIRTGMNRENALEFNTESIKTNLTQNITSKTIFIVYNKTTLNPTLTIKLENVKEVCSYETFGKIKYLNKAKKFYCEKGGSFVKTIKSPFTKYPSNIPSKLEEDDDYIIVLDIESKESFSTLTLSLAEEGKKITFDQSTFTYISSGDISSSHTVLIPKDLDKEKLFIQISSCSESNDHPKAKLLIGDEVISTNLVRSKIFNYTISNPLIETKIKFSYEKVHKNIYDGVCMSYLYFNDNDIKDANNEPLNFPFFKMIKIETDNKNLTSISFTYAPFILDEEINYTLIMIKKETKNDIKKMSSDCYLKHLANEKDRNSKIITFTKTDNSTICNFHKEVQIEITNNTEYIFNLIAVQTSNHMKTFSYNAVSYTYNPSEHNVIIIALVAIAVSVLVIAVTIVVFLKYKKSRDTSKIVKKDVNEFVEEASAMKLLDD